MDNLEIACMDAFAAWWKEASIPAPPYQKKGPKPAFEAGFRAGATYEPKTRWVVIDAKDQVLRCERCGTTHALADGVNHRPIWFATGVMNGFIKEHSQCEERK